MCSILNQFGHSMGCAMLHVAAALHPEIASKIKLMIALAPAVYISNAVTISLTLASKLMPAVSSTREASINNFFKNYSNDFIIGVIPPHKTW